VKICLSVVYEILLVPLCLFASEMGSVYLNLGGETLSPRAFLGYLAYFLNESSLEFLWVRWHGLWGGFEYSSKTIGPYCVITEPSPENYFCCYSVAG